ncbi:hypothetical protein D3C76_957050 [compost metagenome]
MFLIPIFLVCANLPPDIIAITLVYGESQNDLLGIVFYFLAALLNRLVILMRDTKLAILKMMTGWYVFVFKEKG